MFLTPAEVAKRWRIHTETLCRWRIENRGPKFMKLGSKVAYPIGEIEKYERENLFQQTTTKYKTKKIKAAEAKRKNEVTGA